MTSFKCKMCGGDLEITQGTSVAQCEYCGTKQTIPKLPDVNRSRLYDRANHFRRNHEFDKAEYIYERLLDEDLSDAEAYWSLVLCRYGIDYVEDPKTQKRVPTINRSQYTAVFDDENYKAAMKYADEQQRPIYENEARRINEIQKEILSISREENPFDIFICYKETDSQGNRTKESVLAEELYEALTRKNHRVFFSRITLEDRLGTEYEPYIFSALNSAEVMVVLGSDKDYINAPWVRNEWSRFLALIKKGQKKVLIPAYIDMDPYALPDEFANLQALDMGKLGWKQDLVRGIEKLLGSEENQKEKYQPIPTKEELELLVISKYNSYLEKYPLIQEEKHIRGVKSALEEIQSKYKYGGKQFYINLLISIIITAVLCMQEHYVLAATAFIVMLFLNIWVLKTQQSSIQRAIGEYGLKIAEIEEIPTLYQFAPELGKYRSVTDKYFADRDAELQNQAVLKWEEARDEALQRRDQLRRQQLEQAEEKYQRKMHKIGKSEARSISRFEKEKTSLDREKDDKLEILPSLGILQWGKKGEIRDRVTSIDRRLSELETKAERKDKMFSHCKTSASRKLRRNQKKINKKMDKWNVTPIKPEDALKNAYYADAVIAIKNARKKEIQKQAKDGKGYCIDLAVKTKDYCKKK